MEGLGVSCLGLRLLPSGQTTNGGTWLNIEAEASFIGKARCHIGGRVLTVSSIMIFTQFQGRGYGRKTIDSLKRQFAVIIAERVRPSAVGFWQKMGFKPRPDGNWEFRKRNRRA